MEAARSFRLWEIASELDEIGAAFVDGGGELTPELEARLDAMEGAWEDKVERVALFIRECELEAAKAAAEVVRLAAIEKHHATKAEGLRGYLFSVMQKSGRTSHKTHRVRVWTQKNGRPSIRYVGDMSKLPPEYIRTRTETTVDTLFAYTEHQAGVKLPDGFIVESGSHLRIG